LIVNIVDHVAYRVGCAAVSERDWVGLENRKWELVRLG